MYIYIVDQWGRWLDWGIQEGGRKGWKGTTYIKTREDIK